MLLLHHGPVRFVFINGFPFGNEKTPSKFPWTGFLGVYLGTGPGVS